MVAAVRSSEGNGCRVAVLRRPCSLSSVLNKHDFQNDWNPKVFVRYREKGGILIQALGYDTLVENAKKRNQAFFSVLFNE